MKLFCEFDNSAFGSYDVILHASENEMREILDHFGEPDAVPDLIPAKSSKTGEDLYLFFIDSKAREITPVWSFNYAYGRMYNGYGPVGSDLPDFELNLDDYSFRMFTPMEEKQISGKDLPRDEWPDRKPVFRGRDRS